MEVIIKYRHRKASDRDIAISVRPTDRVLYIKAKVAEYLHLPIGEIELSKDDVLLLDDCTLSECHIDNHSIIELNKGFPISLTIKLLSGKHHEIGQYNINAFTDYTVPELKNEISNIVGIPADEQVLIFRGNSLCDETKLKDYSIPEKSEIQVMRRSSFYM